MSDEFLSLPEWIEFVFDHPVTDPAWHWDADARYWDGHATDVARLIAETFEGSGVLLRRFTPDQIGQGLNFVVSPSCSDYMFALVDSEVEMSTRLRALRSISCLFEQVMARRCVPALSHLDEAPGNALNGICYMWWDVIPLAGQPEKPEFVAFDQEIMALMENVLAIPHDACRESALHGLGHWHWQYPGTSDVIDAFLRDTRNLRPELVTYARAARAGCIE